MKVLSDMDIKGTFTLTEEVTQFPSNPKECQFCLKNDILYINLMLDNYLTWCPFNIGITHYTHVQNSSSNQWNISHNLDTLDYIILVYDNLNNIINNNTVTPIDSNNIIINLPANLLGRAVIFPTSSFSSGGSSSIPTFLVNTNINYPTQTGYYLCDCSLTDIIITLSSPLSMLNKSFTFKKILGNYNMIINPNNTETIDGESSIIINRQYESVTLINDSINWYIV